MFGLLKGLIGYIENLVIVGWSRDPIDLMDHPSNMEIGLCWYKKETNNKWTYDLMDHLMVDLETIIASTFITCIVNLGAYELHLED